MKAGLAVFGGLIFLMMVMLFGLLHVWAEHDRQAAACQATGGTYVPASGCVPLPTAR